MNSRLRKWNELTKVVENQTNSSCPWIHVRELQRPHLLTAFPPEFWISAVCNLLWHFVPLHMSRIPRMRPIGLCQLQDHADEWTVVSRDDYRVRLSNSGFYLLCNYNAFWNYRWKHLEITVLWCRQNSPPILFIALISLGGSLWL